MRLIDLASDYYRNKSEKVKNILIFESAKVKLFFGDDTLKKLNRFIESNKKDMMVNYNLLIYDLKNKIK